ncbi:PREDICTED: uncharacterized protein LOC108660696 [Theobroma cacao]|uniref:Uncharacterized protein LOC108660696 n=1 Tax=Theobroma cacao TaxID=3641 RepID=A0AB32VVD4_THECC|nr:PREDICTED: uncharacterized protein LOC108660696 [Theobroma cacao]
MTIISKSEKEVESGVKQVKLQDKPVEHETVIKTIDKQIQEKEEKATLPLLLFSQCFQKQKLDKHFQKFLKVFKKLHINISFAEALEQMLSYVNFLKDILTKKRKLEDFEIITHIEECYAIIQNKLPPKLKDLGSFSILCSIGNFNFSKALCDLGVGVSIMPLSFARKLGLTKI